LKDSELLASIRYSATLNAADPNYTDARLRIEAWNMLVASFADSISRSRSGYWRQFKLYTLNASQRGYRLPARALGNAVELAEILVGTNYLKLHPIELRELGRFESLTGDPRGYLIEGDYLNVYGLPVASGTMRAKFAIRPPKLVEEQTAGRILTVTPATRQVTVNTVPTVRSTGVALATAGLADVVHPTGGFELGAFDCAVTVAGTTITFPAGTDMSRIEVGDYVRGADETDWPMLPEEFHLTLAEATASKICIDRGMMQKASVLAASVGPQIERMKSLIQPRAKFDPRALRRRNYGRTGFGFGPPWSGGGQL